MAKALSSSNRDAPPISEIKPAAIVGPIPLTDHCEAGYDFYLIQVDHVLAFKNFVERLPYTDYQLNTIPGNVPINHFNHTLDRRDYINKKVVLLIREDKHKMNERMCLSEHPFGTVKWYHGAH